MRGITIVARGAPQSYTKRTVFPFGGDGECRPKPAPRQSGAGIEAGLLNHGVLLGRKGNPLVRRWARVLPIVQREPGLAKRTPSPLNWISHDALASAAPFASQFHSTAVEIFQFVDKFFCFFIPGTGLLRHGRVLCAALSDPLSHCKRFLCNSFASACLKQAVDGLENPQLPVS